MYRLLVVDDERHVADWLYEMFTELSEPELDVYKAYSGEDALKILNGIKIDIVLTDIRMPGMSGLELADTVYRNWPDSRIIFLTGYNSHEYVYNAIKYEGVRYLMKTEDDEEIVIEVKKAVHSIEESLYSRALIDKAKKEEKIIQYLVRRQIILDIMNGTLNLSDSDKNSDEISGLNHEYCIKQEKPVFLLLGRISDMFGERVFPERLDMYLRIELLTDKYLSHGVNFVVADVDKTDILWVFQSKGNDAGEKNQETGQFTCERSIVFVAEMLETFQKALSKSINLEMSFVLYKKTLMFNEAGDILEILESALNRESNTNSGMNMIYSVTLHDKSDIYLPSEKVILPHYSQIKNVNILKTYLEQGMRDKFNNLIADLFEQFKKIYDIHCLYALEIYNTIALMYISYINRYRLDEKVSQVFALKKLSGIEKFNSWDDMLDYVQQLTDKLFELQKAEWEDKDNNIIQRIKLFIEENIDGDLSLANIARHVNYNPSYVSRLFKQITGNKLFNYINNERIQKAKTLLKSTTDNIYDIAKVVGFDSPQYFATVFRKANGLSPQKYREL